MKMHLRNSIPDVMASENKTHREGGTRRSLSALRANICAVSRLPQILPLVELEGGNFLKMTKLSALLPLLLPLTEGQGRKT